MAERRTDMKIVFVSKSRIPSKTANSVQVMKMCQAFSQCGHQVQLLVPDVVDTDTAEDPFDFYGISSSFEIIRLPWPKFRGRTFYYAMSVARYARTCCPDIVYGRFLVGLLFCGLIGLPVVYESHKPVEDDGRLNRWSFAWLTKFQAFRRLVVISAALGKHFRSVHRVSDEKIVVAHDAADEPVTEKIRVLPGTGALKVGYIGHLYPGKGVEIIEPLATLCPWADFHIIGGMPEDVDFWRNKLAHLDNVFLHGFVPHRETSGYRSACDVLLAPYLVKVSAFGGGDISNWMSPLKIFEYMAAGKAILCSDLPVLREVLREGENALLRSSDAPADWAEALTLLRDDPQLASRLGEAARRNYLQSYTWKSRAEAVLAGLS